MFCKFDSIDSIDQWGKSFPRFWQSIDQWGKSFPRFWQLVKRARAPASQTCQVTSCYGGWNVWKQASRMKSNVPGLSRSEATKIVSKNCLAIKWPLETRVVESTQRKTTLVLGWCRGGNARKPSKRATPMCLRWAHLGHQKSTENAALQQNGHWKPELLRGRDGQQLWFSAGARAETLGNHQRGRNPMCLS